MEAWTDGDRRELTPLQALRTEVMAGGEAWRRHWRAQDRRTRWAVRWAAYRGRTVRDPDLCALVVGYARRQAAPLWPAALAVAVVVISLATITLGSALEWEAETILAIVGICLVVSVLGALALALTQR